MACNRPKYHILEAGTFRGKTAVGEGGPRASKSWDCAFFFTKFLFSWRRFPPKLSSIFPVFYISFARLGDILLEGEKVVEFTFSSI